MQYYEALGLEPKLALDPEDLQEALLRAQPPVASRPVQPRHGRRARRSPGYDGACLTTPFVPCAIRSRAPSIFSKNAASSFQRRSAGAARRSLRAEHGAGGIARRRRFGAAAADRMPQANGSCEMRTEIDAGLAELFRGYDASENPADAGRDSPRARTGGAISRTWFGCRKYEEGIECPPFKLILARRKSQIVGIDLGTTNSLVAVMDLTGPRILSGHRAQRGFRHAGIGRSHRRRGGSRHADHASGAHRVFGEAADGPRDRGRCQDELKLFPFHLADGSESVLQLAAGRQDHDAAGSLGAHPAQAETRRRSALWASRSRKP